MADKVLARFDGWTRTQRRSTPLPLKRFPEDDRSCCESRPYLVIKALLPAMKKQGWGRIVNIAPAGKMGPWWLDPLHRFKAGIAMAKSWPVTVSYASSQHRAPGPTATEMTADWTEEEMARLTQNIPLGRYGTMEEIAAGVLYLVSEEAGFVTGECLDVNGGLWMD